MLDDIFEEVKERLEEELDYLTEAANIHRFEQVWGGDPDIRLPTVYSKLSSERVLTMKRISGVPLRQFLESDPPREARQRAGATLPCRQLLLTLRPKAPYRWRSRPLQTVLPIHGRWRSCPMDQCW